VSNPFRSSAHTVMAPGTLPSAAVAVSDFAGLFDTLTFQTLQSTKASEMMERDSWQREWWKPCACAWGRVGGYACDHAVRPV